MADSVDSILTNTKKVLGLEESYTVFDPDVILHINSVFSTLNQLGIGPDDGYAIVDASANWSDFLGDNLRFNSVKSYVYLKVRLLFDPPTTQYLVEAYKEQISELEWRLNVVRESTEWVDPDPPKTCDDDSDCNWSEDPSDPGTYILDQT